MIYTNRLIVFLLIVSSLVGISGAFDLKDLPQGKNVTLIRSTITKIPLLARVKLSVSESPQSVSFRLRKGAKDLESIRLAIYDTKQESVHYQKISPGMVYSYTIKDSGSVVVIPEPMKKVKPIKSLYLLVQSDKPLNVAR